MPIAIDLGDRLVGNRLDDGMGAVDCDAFATARPGPRWRRCAKWQTGEPSRGSVKFLNDEPRDDFERYIYEHLEGDLRPETLADHFGLSVRTFNRLFRKRVGMPPGRFAEQCRIEWARQLLKETGEPVSRIAGRSGYVTSNGLCLAFERNLGATPRAYRRRFASSERAQALAHPCSQHRRFGGLPGDRVDCWLLAVVGAICRQPSVATR